MSKQNRVDRLFGRWVLNLRCHRVKVRFLKSRERGRCGRSRRSRSRGAVLSVLKLGATSCRTGLVLFYLGAATPSCEREICEANLM